MPFWKPNEQGVGAGVRLELWHWLWLCPGPLAAHLTERDTTCIKVSVHSTSVGIWEEAYVLHLVSPELAPDGIGLRPQEHQRSALFVDIVSIFSLCPPLFNLKVRSGPQVALESQSPWP